MEEMKQYKGLYRLLNVTMACSLAVSLSLYPAQAEEAATQAQEEAAAKEAGTAAQSAPKETQAPVQAETTVAETEAEKEEETNVLFFSFPFSPFFRTAMSDQTPE